MPKVVDLAGALASCPTFDAGHRILWSDLLVLTRGFRRRWADISGKTAITPDERVGAGDVMRVPTPETTSAG